MLARKLRLNPGPPTRRIFCLQWSSCVTAVLFTPRFSNDDALSAHIAAPDQNEETGSSSRPQPCLGRVGFSYEGSSPQRRINYQVREVLTWKGSFATLGRFDVVDLLEAEAPKQIEKAAMIIRAYGHSMTETLVATPWKEFLATL